MFCVCVQGKGCKQPCMWEGKDFRLDYIKWDFKRVIIKIHPIRQKERLYLESEDKKDCVSMCL